jgi:sensor histidine kinase YesM
MARPPDATAIADRHASRHSKGWHPFDSLRLISLELPIYLMTVSAAYAALFYRRYQDRQTSLNRARLETLRSQLQPHFLFNTLNTIASLVHEDPNKADRVLMALSELLRLCLETTTQDTVPLHRELEFTERYLLLMHTRFENRLRYLIEVSPETRSALVPTLLLQPLVENAVEHGLQPKQEGGFIQISTSIRRKRLLITISDDGIGFPEGEPLRMGIGLRNTVARLEERYGRIAQMKVSSNQGTTIEITLPYQPAP